MKCKWSLYCCVIKVTLLWPLALLHDKINAKDLKQKRCGGMRRASLMILPQVFGVPWMREYEAFHVFELVDAIVYGFAHTIRTLPSGSKTPAPFNLVF